MAEPKLFEGRFHALSSKLWEWVVLSYAGKGKLGESRVREIVWLLWAKQFFEVFWLEFLLQKFVGQKQKDSWASRRWGHLF